MCRGKKIYRWCAVIMRRYFKCPLDEMIPARSILMKSQRGEMLPLLSGSYLFHSLPYFLDLLAQSALLPTHPPPLRLTSCVSLSPLSLSLCLSNYQGAEAQSDAAAQRTQVPDTRLHRVSEAEVRLLRQHVADPPFAGGQRATWKERGEDFLGGGLGRGPRGWR